MKADMINRDKFFHYLYFVPPRPWILTYVIVNLALYFFIKTHTPLALDAGKPHDDTLFMMLGLRIASGEWLGPYNEYTLMKGPGFPLFLAIGNWSGLPISAVIALFHSLAVTSFVVVCHRFVQSFLLSGLLFTLLLWHPASLTPPLLSMLRDSIYYAQGLLFFAAFIGAIFWAGPGLRRWMLAVASGLVFGWLWLTREESIWVAPGVAILCAAAALYAFRERKVFQLASVLLLFGVVFVGVNVAYRSLNWWVYGKFVGVDFLEPNYQRALRAIHSVRSGETKRYISATKKTQEAINAVSPTFASLRAYFDGQSTDSGWAWFTCQQYSASCGEVATGWFIFALRDAAAQRGHYATPEKASAFFGKIADEITAACSSGQLECRTQLIAEMPPLNWSEVIADIPRAYRDGLRLILTRRLPLDLNASVGTDQQLAPVLYVLNYPRYVPSVDMLSETYALSGWYFRGNTDWISVRVTTPTKYDAPVSIVRSLSPDLVLGFKTPSAGRQRFLIQTRCSENCMIRIQGDDGAAVEKRLGDFKQSPIGFMIGEGHFNVDQTVTRMDPVATRHLSDRVTNAARRFIVKWYEFLFVPLLALGVVAFVLASVRSWRKALWDICYVLALTSWVLVFMRVTVLVAMEVTSATTVINPLYGAPTFFHLVCAAILSIAAWAGLSRSSSLPVTSAPVVGTT